MDRATFEWDSRKNDENREKHGIDFFDAQHGFGDPRRVIAEDTAHSQSERRYFCFGMVNGGVLTVRFIWRSHVVRIIGAGYWRKGKGYL